MQGVVPMSRKIVTYNGPSMAFHALASDMNELDLAVSFSFHALEIMQSLFWVL